MARSPSRRGTSRRSVVWPSTCLAPFAALALSACVGDVVQSSTAFPAAAPGSSPNVTLGSDGGVATAWDGGVAEPIYIPPIGTDGAVLPPPSGDAGLPGSGSGDGGSTEVPTGTDPCSNEDLRFARDVTLSGVSLYQVVEVPLYEDGALVTTRDVPVVQGKRALVRVHVKPGSTFSSRALRAVLTLQNDGPPTRLTRDLQVASASTKESLASTFNFEVDGALIGPSTRFSAAVVETACGGALGSAASARVPSADTAELAAEQIRKLRVVVVPTTINNITSTPTQDQLTQMRASMLAYYPVPDVEITVRSTPYDLSSAWACGTGDGWGCALDAIVALRTREAPTSDVYYYGVLTPASSFRQYCGSGCTLGVAYAATRQSARYQVGIGIGYANDLTYDTMVHELGHAHGRQHAPCAPGGSLDPGSIDPNFPSATAETQVWGWDSRSGALMPPTHKDVMSYCDPHWIGEYNYGAIAARSKSVNVTAYTYGAQVSSTGITYRNLIVGSRGAAYGQLSEQGTPPGEALWADVLDARGAVLDRVLVYKAELSNETTWFLFVPTLPTAAATLHVLADAPRDITLPAGG
jgi:hypothetical protein